VRRNIDTSLLRSFVAVAETGSMTTAARQLHLTQAAVSQQIKRLEELFDRPLFDRDLRKLTLTSSGGMLLAKAPRLLAMNDEIWATMTAPDFAGEVRLGVPHDIISPYIPPILKSFDKAWPDVRVYIVAGVTVELQEQLKNGAVDLCLTTEQSPQKGGEKLLREPLVWVGAPNGTAYLRDPLPVALGDQGCIFRNAVLERLAKAGRNWRSVCETSAMQPLYVSVEADLGVTALLASSVPANLAILGPNGDLPKLPDFHICLYLPRAGSSDIADELARHIRGAFIQGQKAHAA
jgi:DNA-binding transcriptional LysR family regulator